jgi:hypothetical protein
MRSLREQQQIWQQQIWQQQIWQQQIWGRLAVRQRLRTAGGG